MSAISKLTTILLKHESVSKAPVELLQDEQNSAVLREVVHRLTTIVKEQGLPAAQEIIEAGAAAHLVKYAQHPEVPILPLLVDISRWCAKALVDANAIGVMAKLLDSDAWAIHHAIAVLGNIASEGIEYRNMVLKVGVFGTIVSHTSSSSLELQRTATWAVHHMLRFSPCPDLHLIAVAIGPLVQLLHPKTDPDVLELACTALSFVGNCDDDRVSEVQIQAILNAGALPKAIELLNIGHERITNAVLSLLCHISRGSDTQTQELLKHDVIAKISPLLQHSNRKLRSGALAVMSNIAAGIECQIQALIDANLVPIILKLLQHDVDPQTRRDAAWTICNMLRGGTVEHIRYIISMDGITPLLGIQDPRMIHPVLHALSAALEAGFSGDLANVPAFLKSRLQSGPEITAQASNLLTQYWPDFSTCVQFEQMAIH